MDDQDGSLQQSENFSAPAQIPRTSFLRRVARAVLLFVIFIVVILAVAYGAAALYARKVAGSVAQPSSSAMSAFTIAKGENFLSVGSALASKKIISSAFAFDAYVFFTGHEHRLESGEYVLSPSMALSQITSELSGGVVIGQFEVVRIREGGTIAQLGSQLQAQGLGTAAEFQAQVDVASQTYGYMGENLATKSLEGYLFPDTYFISQKNPDPDLISEALNNFSEKVTPLMPQVQASGISLHDVVTLASIVEKEVSRDADRKIVAGIFLKRLSIGMPLESNATLGYVLGGNTSMLSTGDLQTNSPYNDYAHAGLPPTPIGSPSLSSIQAVLDPTKTDYLYFIAAPDGTVVYASTLAQQDANIQKYLR